MNRLAKIAIGTAILVGSAIALAAPVMLGGKAPPTPAQAAPEYSAFCPHHQILHNGRCVSDDCSSFYYRLGHLSECGLDWP